MLLYIGCLVGFSCCLLLRKKTCIDNATCTGMPNIERGDIILFNSFDPSAFVQITSIVFQHIGIVDVGPNGTLCVFHYVNPNTDTTNKGFVYPGTDMHMTTIDVIYRHKLIKIYRMPELKGCDISAMCKLVAHDKLYNFDHIWTSMFPTQKKLHCFSFIGLVLHNLKIIPDAALIPGYLERQLDKRVDGKVYKIKQR
jgi:hypothetical protein